MRRILLFIPVMLVLLYSCNDEPDPYADFTVSATLVEVNENIRFTNTSLNARDVEWDFGDGFVSNAYNPVHYFEDPGIYDVKLTVWSRGNKVSMAYQTIEVIHPQPYADFTVSATIVEVNENVQFTNTSLNASTVEWNFGDGYVSNDFNPIHYYDKPGSYIVKLTIWSPENEISIASQTIEVVYPTATLDIQVMEYFQEYPVADASVILYGSYMDWMDELNPIIEGFTDVDGIVVFTGLPAKEYFVDVWEANHDNYALAEEDIGFISTGVLYPGEINYFTAWVDYYPPTKSGTANKLERRERNMKIESKDRKYSDKPKRERKK